MNSWVISQRMVAKRYEISGHPIEREFITTTSGQRYQPRNKGAVLVSLPLPVEVWDLNLFGLFKRKTTYLGDIVAFLQIALKSAHLVENNSMKVDSDYWFRHLKCQFWRLGLPSHPNDNAHKYCTWLVESYRNWYRKCGTTNTFVHGNISLSQAWCACALCQ